MVDLSSEPLRILLIEDNPADARLTLELLREAAAFKFDLIHETSFLSGLSRLAAEKVDIILLDLSLGDASGIPMVTRLCGENPTLPLIVLSGLEDEGMALASIQQGAQDYIIKGRGDGHLIARSICYALERKHIDRQLIEAKLSTEAANRAKSEFLANMSHELRTPLNAIIGFSELIERLPQNTAEAKWQEYAHCIHMSGMHLLEIISDILDLSKIEYGKLTLREEPVDVGETIRFVLNMVHERMAAARQTLVTDVPSGLPPLFADERLVRQALLNLLSNAVKFTGEGGTIEVAAAVDSAGDFSIRVKDSGIGIPPEDLARVCQPFVQIENALNRQHEGTGLGLALTKSILELHDGSLEITSRIGLGTSAKLCFPATRTMGRAVENVTLCA
jgi:signal transduction histidine kinase